MELQKNQKYLRILKQIYHFMVVQIHSYPQLHVGHMMLGVCLYICAHRYRYVHMQVQMHTDPEKGVKSPGARLIFEIPDLGTEV